MKNLLSSWALALGLVLVILGFMPAQAADASAAEQYAVASAPSVAKWIGANLRPLILAKLSSLGIVPEDASAAAVNAAIAK